MSNHPQPLVLLHPGCTFNKQKVVHTEQKDQETSGPYKIDEHQEKLNETK
jgi:hypothetical protein